MATEIMNEEQRREALNNLTKHYPRLPDGSLVPLTSNQREELDIQKHFIEHHGHAVVFDGNGGWYFEDNDPSKWDPTV